MSSGIESIAYADLSGPVGKRRSNEWPVLFWYGFFLSCYNKILPKM